MTRLKALSIVNKVYIAKYNEPPNTSFIHHKKYDDLFSFINLHYTKNDIRRALLGCIKLLKRFPLRTEIYYTIALMFEGDPLSYTFYKHFALHSKNIEIIREAFNMAKSVDLKDALYFIKKLQRREDSLEIHQEKEKIYKMLYNQTGERQYYMRVLYTEIEGMKYTGFRSLKEYANLLGYNGMKRAIKTIAKMLKDHTDWEYIEEFLAICFEYEEYVIFLSFSNVLEETLENRLKILVAIENVGIIEERKEELVSINYTVNINGFKNVVLEMESDKAYYKQQLDELNTTLNNKNVNMSKIPESNRSFIKEKFEQSENNGNVMDLHNKETTNKTKHGFIKIADNIFSKQSLIIPGSNYSNIKFTPQNLICKRYKISNDSNIKQQENVNKNGTESKYYGFIKISDNVYIYECLIENIHKLSQTAIKGQNKECLIGDCPVVNQAVKMGYNKECLAENIYEYIQPTISGILPNFMHQYHKLYNEIITKDWIGVNEVIERCDEYFIENEPYIINGGKSAVFQIENFLSNISSYVQISQTHFLLLDILFKNRSYKKISMMLDNMIQRLKMFDKSLLELNVEDLRTYKSEGKLPEIITKNKVLYYMGLYYRQRNIYNKAIILLVFLEQGGCNNDDVKRNLKEIYISMGEFEKAGLFDEIFFKKRESKLTSENITNTRIKYQELVNMISTELNPDIIEQFIAASSDLLEDFFNNEFIFNEYIKQAPEGDIKKRRRRKYKDICDELITNDDACYSKRERRRLFREYRNFHGLSFDEWCYLIRSNILFLIQLGKYKRGIEIVKSFVHARLRKGNLRMFNDKMMSIGLLGLKYALIYNDIDNFVYILLKLTNKPYSLLSFAMNYFNNYWCSDSYKRANRNLCRVFIRNNAELYSLFNFEISNTNEKTFEENTGQQKLYIPRKEKYEDLTIPEKQLWLNSLHPRYLHKKTINALLTLKPDGTKATLHLAILLLNHSTTKRTSRVEECMKRGFDMLLKLDKDEDTCKWYNIGRAYHLFGVLGLAEFYYKKALNNRLTMGYAYLNLLSIYKKKKLDQLYFKYERDYLQSMGYTAPEDLNFM